MKFEFNASKDNYEDFAAGRVLLSQVGMTSFPMRLASELFQLCYAYLGKPKLRVFDPCCGTGYLLTGLGFLHHTGIAALYGADIQLKALELARKNLALLTLDGLKARQTEIQSLYAAYGKDSHAEALESCDRLQARLPQDALLTGICLADATERTIAAGQIDLLIVDLPYGEKVAWETSKAEPLQALLEAHYPLFAQPALAVIISDKSQKAAHPAYRRYKQLLHGKRRISILEPI